ncbi:endothelin-converting enzyme 1-like [Haemaphysalis longicornis]
MKRRDSPVVCHSAACSELNDLLTASINATVKPCDNFYRHVCGGSPTGRPASVYWKHLDRFGRDLISVNNEALIPQSGQTPAQKAALFLRTCLLAVRFEVNSQVAMFRGKFTSLGVSWPHVSNVPNVLATATKVYATFGIAPLLEVARSRVGDGDKPYLSVGPGGVLPAWKDKRDRLIESGSYEQFYKETAKLYTSSSVTAEGIDFKRFQLLGGCVLEKLVYAERNHAAVAALSTVRHLQNITTNVDPQAWRTLVTSELGLEESTPVKVRNRDYLLRFNDVIGQVGEADLHFYLGWCVVQAAARLMSRSLSDLWYNETRPVLDDRADLSFSSPSTADCLQLTEFAVGWALFHPLMRTRADTPVRDSITTMAGNIGMNLVKRIEAAQWLNQNSSSPVTKLDFEEVLYHSSRFMDENTLDKLFANVSDMHDMLFTNWANAVRSTSQMPKSVWDQVSSTYLTNVRTKPYFAAFDARSQSIRVPPYLLTMPVFDKDLTDGAKYGLLGTLIGAASIRLLLARLSRNDSRASELAEARKRMDCYAGSQTNAVQRERLHMAASVPVVWEAFLTAKLFGRGDRRGLRDFPSEKLFFVTMCYLLCDDRYLPEGAELTCNTAASNSPAFKTTFRCKAGTPMNPKKKCLMF